MKALLQCLGVQDGELSPFLREFAYEALFVRGCYYSDDDVDVEENDTDHDADCKNGRKLLAEHLHLLTWIMNHPH